MEDEAIKKGFAELRPGREYDGLHQSALCRARADWLVGINATKALFRCCTTAPLNVGRVLSPTLALIVQRGGGDRGRSARKAFLHGKSSLRRFCRRVRKV